MGARAAIYWRVSSAEQGENYSPAGQVKACREYADRQQYRVVRILGDTESGRTMDRPAFQHLMGLARRGAFDLLIVWKGDRLARNELGVGQYRKKLREWGVRVESVQFGPQPDTPASRFSTRMVDLFSEFDRDNIVERTSMGRYGAARDGCWPCKAMYGYRKEIPRTASKLEIVPEEAKLLREAYAACIAGWNRDRVGEIMGVCGYRGAERLKNPAYKGQAMYGEIMVPCPPIVDEATWQAANDALVSRRHNRGGTTPGFPYWRETLRALPDEEIQRLTGEDPAA